MHESSTARPRYDPTITGYGNREPHDEPKRVWTEADVAEFNEGVRRARIAYYAEPFAGTRDLNDNDRARERMAARRAEKRKS